MNDIRNWFIGIFAVLTVIFMLFTPSVETIKQLTQFVGMLVSFSTVTILFAIKESDKN